MTTKVGTFALCMLWMSTQRFLWPIVLQVSIGASSLVGIMEIRPMKLHYTVLTQHK